MSDSPAPVAVVAEANEQRKHHQYSPSTLQNLEACPCYQGRKGEVHEAATRGTMQHAVAETGEDDQRLTDEEAVATAECLDAYQQKKLVLVLEQEAENTRRINEAVKAGQAQYIPAEQVLDLTEIHLSVDDVTWVDHVVEETVKLLEGGKVSISHQLVLDAVKSTTSGYVDRVLISWNRKRAVMLDWKFGAWAVAKAIDNLQGIAYALGLFRAYPELEEVEVTFKQPALNYTTTHTWKRSDIPELYLRVQTVVNRAREARKKMLQDDFSMAQPHVPVCNFCANLGKCPKVRALATKVANKYWEAEVPSDIFPTGLKTDEEIAVILKLAGIVAVWAKAAKQTISDRAMRDQKLPDGYTLVEKRDRDITDSKKFVEISKKFLPPQVVEDSASYSFGPLEKAINEAAARGTKKDAIAIYRQALVDGGAVTIGEPYHYLKAVSKPD